jgi:predicted DNA-binding transcriptional regulator AlpA
LTTTASLAEPVAEAEPREFNVRESASPPFAASAPPADDNEPPAPVKRAAREIPLGARLLNGPQVLVYFGNVSKMWIERRLEDDPTFPKPVYIKGKRYWMVVELEDWLGRQPRSAPAWLLAGAEKGNSGCGALVLAGDWSTYDGSYDWVRGPEDEPPPPSFDPRPSIFAHPFFNGVPSWLMR